ncbi:gametogenetin-binding protein 2-like isoform X1 [Trichogramma pretiosum]|uniref:gametogenetin-binding protein 2-like isoform X1 n=1 Tax=Trichogramma pretiosum TaxID=7493 RepID=UPI0006C9A5A5|nr:gametogenetin-binding protein 2-like isoform X1 [Trichogramma pretiosum]
MAKLVKMWKDSDSTPLGPRQLPLFIDENYAMVMDISGLTIPEEKLVSTGKQIEEFKKKFSLLSENEQSKTFEAALKDVLSVLDQSVPCIGCRRSVEKLFHELSKLESFPPLDPIIFSENVVTFNPKIFKSPGKLCAYLRGYSSRLNDLVDQQPRNKKSRRCTLHSLEVQRMRLSPHVWREVWDGMEAECLSEITFIDSETLRIILDAYLRKHKFCAECRTKVVAASNFAHDEKIDNNSIDGCNEDNDKNDSQNSHNSHNNNDNYEHKNHKNCNNHENHDDHKDLTDHKCHAVRKDHENCTSPLGHKSHPDNKCYTDLKDHCEYKDFKDHKTSKDNKDVKVRKINASDLYASIRRCSSGHVHLPMKYDYICNLIARTTSDSLSRERHAKTKEIAQEEVLTCLGVCVYERLNRVYKKMKEEEFIINILVATAMSTISRNFQIAIETKQGFSQLEVLYHELEKEKIAKTQRREKSRLKRKKRKERRFEVEEKQKKSEVSDTTTDKSSEDDHNKEETLTEGEDLSLQSQPFSESNTQNKISDLMCNESLTCNCLNCIKNSTNKTELSAFQSQFGDLNLKNEREKICCQIKSSATHKNEKIDQSSVKVTLSNSSRSCRADDSPNKNIWESSENCKEQEQHEDLIDGTFNSNKHDMMWIEVKKKITKSTYRNRCTYSENSSHDYGYSSEHVSSSSLPSTPEGSEVACSDGCCNGGDHPDIHAANKNNFSHDSLFPLIEHGRGPLLSQMLEDSDLSEMEDDSNSIPEEEVLEFKSREVHITEKRQELRQELKNRFTALCNCRKPFIPR